MPEKSNPWIVGRYAPSRAHTRVLCFAQAGGGAASFAVWRPHLPEGLELVPIQLPGREARQKEPLPTDLRALAGEIVTGVESFLDRPYALLGHSLGGILAYEVTRELHRRACRRPEALLVSAARPPQLRPPEILHRLSDEELLTWLRGMGGIPSELLQHEEYLAAVLRVTRADLRMGESYVAPDEGPLATPIHVFGSLDDPMARPELLREWRDISGADFSITFYPGGHFYLYEDPAPLLTDIAEHLAKGADAVPAAPQVLRRDPESPVNLRGDYAADGTALSSYLRSVDDHLAALPARQDRGTGRQARAEALHRASRTARRLFLERHGDRVYDAVTDGRRRFLDLRSLADAVADLHPGLVPGRERMAAERALPQVRKEGWEVDQGILFQNLLGRADTGAHLMRAIRRPTARAETMLTDFRRTGRADLGEATIERRDGVGHVTIRNERFLNAEDDAVVDALETAVDLALLDDSIAVGALRGAPMTHSRYAGRRVFSAGINLTHLYEGKISLIDFLLRRELGYLSKIVHGVYAQPDRIVEKPWIGAVDTFAIGGGMQILLTLDRVVAADGAYFNLPALREGIIPGAGNLRLNRFLGSRFTRQTIFWGRNIHTGEPDGRLICDEVVPDEQMDKAVEVAARHLANPAVIGNRRMLHLVEEPLDLFRRYMAEYAYEQARRLYSPDMIENLERTWVSRRRG